MAVVLCSVLGMAGIAEAGRKRVVVLDFEGPKSERFHEDLVKLLKKSHTVVSVDKWNGTAEELDSTGTSERNLKKVAKRLKIDAIIEGRIEKRRDAYILHLKLHAGKTGELVGGTIDTKADGPRIDGKAQRDIKNELLEALDSVEANRDWEVAADDGEDARPARRGAKKTEDEDEDKPARKARKTEDEDEDKPARKLAKQDDEEEEEDRPARKGFGKLGEDERGGAKVGKRAAEEDEDKPARPVKKAAPVEREDDELPPRKLASAAEDEDDDAGERKARAKKVAADDEESGGEAEAEAGPAMDPVLALSPGERALDAVAGVSVTMRRMSFRTRSGFMAKPAGYRGKPVGGGMIDATLYPLAISHARRDVLKNVGLTVMYDRVVGINSKDPRTGIKLDTKESRYSFGAVFRHPLGRSADAMVIGGSLAYGRQFFSIAGQPDSTLNSSTYLPGVSYTIIEPGVFLRYPISGKLGLGLDGKVMLFTNAGQIQQQDNYGTAQLLGFEGAVNLDYAITRNLFARAAVRFETIGFSFEGNGARANARDGDMTTADVTGARDSYFGGIVTAGYAY